MMTYYYTLCILLAALFVKIQFCYIFNKLHVSFVLTEEQYDIAKRLKQAIVDLQKVILSSCLKCSKTLFCFVLLCSVSFRFVSFRFVFLSQLICTLFLEKVKKIYQLSTITYL